MRRPRARPRPSSRARERAQSRRHALSRGRSSVMLVPRTHLQRSEGRASRGRAATTDRPLSCAPPMEKIETRLEGPILVKPTVHGDERGFFQETYRRDAYAQLGIEPEFVQDNHSRSRRGIVRGMHFQPGQAKLVRCVRGEILDVVCDIRPDSAAFGQWEAVVLSDSNHHQLYVPDGFAHGFAVTSEVADVVYKVSSYYDAAAEAGFRYDDPAVAIEWPEIELTPSARDSSAPPLADVRDELREKYAALTSG